MLDLGLAAEEVLGVFLGKGGEAGVGMEVLRALDPKRHVLELADQGVGGIRSTLAIACHGALDDRRPG